MLSYTKYQVHSLAGNLFQATRSIDKSLGCTQLKSSKHIFSSLPNDSAERIKCLLHFSPILDVCMKQLVDENCLFVLSSCGCLKLSTFAQQW